MPEESPKPNPSPIHSFERKNFKMAWMRDFREMLRENPGIIKTAIELMDQAIDAYHPDNFKIGGEGIELEYDKENAQWLMDKYTQEKDASGQWQQVPSRKEPIDFGRKTILVMGNPIVDETTGLAVVVLGRSNRELVSWFETRIDKCDYFKLTLKGKSFFIKRSFIANNPGFLEFKNNISAKEALKGLDFVKVVKAQLGYQDKDESWYISEWEELESSGFNTFDTAISFDDYGNLKERPSIETKGFHLGFGSKEKHDAAKEKYELIKEKLESIGLDHDLTANLFYSHKTETFILLDVTGNDKESMLGEAIKDH